MITQVVITAGGAGTRLKPLTNSIPKVMIPLDGKPLLEHHIDHFKKHGAGEFFLTLHYMPEKITEYFGDGSQWGVKIFYHIEKTPLGDMGGIKAFEDALHVEFFFLWGDVYTAVDYLKMAERFHALDGAVGIERVEKVEYKSEADFVGLDERMRFVEIHKKNGERPKGPVHRLRGSTIYRKRILSHISGNTPFYKGKDLLPRLLETGEEIYGYECSEYSKGIDTMEKYQEVEEYIKKTKER